MNRKKKCCRMVLALLLSLPGCARGDETFPVVFQDDVAAVASVSVPELRKVRVPYLPADPLNPYLMRTQVNRSLVPLLYDALVRLDQSFQPQNDLAESIEINGNLCTVRLRAGLRFSNGAPLTAQDVVYSFSLCRQKDMGRRYGNVASCVAADMNTVLFTLGRPDIYFKNLLTFPVIPNEAGTQMTPPGTGRYVPASGTALACSGARAGEKPKIETVELTPLESEQEIGYKLMSGQLDVALLDPDKSPMETAGSYPVQKNNMIYLGFNTLMAPADDISFRQALEKICDRHALVHDAYNGRATAAALPIHPSFYTADVPEADPAGAAALLDAMGLNEISADGWRTADGEEIELQLCFNVESPVKREAAAVLKKQIESCQIRVALNEYNFQQYQEQVASGGYHLYLGETRLPEDMDISAFLSQRGALHYALGDTALLAESYFQARRGNKEMADFFQEFSAERLIIPLAFDQAVVAHARNFYSTVVATEQDIFYNIEKW